MVNCRGGSDSSISYDAYRINESTIVVIEQEFRYSMSVSFLIAVLSDAMKV